MLNLYSIGGLTVLMTLSGFLAVYLAEEARQLWREKRKIPANYQVTMLDEDGIPIRQDKLTANGIARLIRDLNSGYYR